jgi:hypothetical protein
MEVTILLAEVRGYETAATPLDLRLRIGEFSNDRTGSVPNT